MYMYVLLIELPHCCISQSHNVMADEYAGKNEKEFYGKIIVDYQIYTFRHVF